jgi:hypothetical protein
MSHFAKLPRLCDRVMEFFLFELMAGSDVQRAAADSFFSIRWE